MKIFEIFFLLSMVFVRQKFDCCPIFENVINYKMLDLISIIFCVHDLLGN